MSRARQKGTSAETALVKYLRDNGFPHAERRALHGTADKGDVTGTPGVAWEVKNHKSYDISGWLKETEVERVNALAEYGILVVKPNRIGLDSVNQWWAILSVADVVELLNFAGFGAKR